MKMQRSSFLMGAASGLALVGSTDHFLARALAQSPLDPRLGGDDRVLVVVNFQGGNDGLNTIVPFADPAYYRNRPSLAVTADSVLRLNEQVGFNPKLQPLKDMYDKGMVAVVQSVGYPKPDLSHFRSSEIWQTAAPDAYLATGWLGRYLDGAGLPTENLFNAAALAEQVLPAALVGERVDVPVIPTARGYGLASDRTAVGRDAFHELVASTEVPFQSPYLARVASIEDHAQRGAQELPKLTAGYTKSATYPTTSIAQSLALAAQIIGSNLGTRVLYVQHGSFDTHTTQRQTQDRLLADFADATSAFYTDLAAHGNDKRVLLMTFSEFGRRVAENGSRGTDHGTAAPVFLIGGGIKGGIIGTHPSLDDLDNGNLRFATDFRGVYATVLEKWLNRPSTPILGGRFPTFPLA